MKVVIIHSNARKGNTYRATELVKESLIHLTDLELKEFTLSTDMPHFCTGCHSCFENGEHTCGHFQALKPLVDAIEWADGLILTSPVYVMGPSGNMKAFLDHLGYMWLSHRPRPSNFSKIGMSLSTAAGGGMSKSNKMMEDSLKYMGFKRYYSLGFRAMELGLEKERSRQKVDEVTQKFYQSYVDREKLRQLPFQKFFARVMRSMIKKYGPDSMLAIDRKYWEEKGWLDRKSIWK